MMRKLCWSLCLLCLCTACGTFVRPGSSLHDEVAVGEETVDKGCAYFYFMWGKTAELERRLEEALEAYEKALVCDPEAEYVMRELAVFYLKLNRNDDGLRLVDDLLALHPLDNEIRTLKAGLLASVGRMEEATNIYKAILVENPDDFDTMLRLGSLYAGIRRYEEARKIFEKLVLVDDSSFVGHQYLAKLYWQIGEYEKAIAAYDKALDLHWMPKLALEVVDLLEYRKHYEKAISFCRRILKNNPDDASAWQRLVRLYMGMGSPDKAVAELRELRHRAVNVFDLDLTIGRIFIEQKHYDKAIAHFSEMLNADSNSGNIRYLLALSYGAADNEDEAVRLLSQVTVDDIVYEDAVLLLVELLGKGGRAAEVEGILLKAIAEPDSRRPRFYGVLANVYLISGRVAEGQQLFESALPLYPQDGRLRYEYALFLDRAGDQDKALTIMQTALVLDPHNPYVLNYVGYVLADRGENLTEALSLIQKAIVMRPDDGFIRDSLGWVYFKLGEDEKAVAELKKALELVKDPVILEHLGDVHSKAGRVEEAVDAYQNALSIFHTNEDLQRLSEKIKALRSDTQ